MSVKFIDELAVKRVNSEGELESTTLRSDLVARYLFMNEALLNGLGIVKSSDLTVCVDNQSLEQLLLDTKAKMATDVNTQITVGGYDGLLKELDNPEVDLEAVEAKWGVLSGKKFIEIVRNGNIDGVPQLQDVDDVNDMLGEMVDL